MATEESSTQDTQVPEWEHEAGRDSGNERGEKSSPRTQTGASFKAKFDTILPSHRKYLGLSRKLFLYVLLGALVLLILIIGLAAGLSNKSRYVT